MTGISTSIGMRTVTSATITKAVVITATASGSLYKPQGLLLISGRPGRFRPGLLFCRSALLPRAAIGAFKSGRHFRDPLEAFGDIQDAPVGACPVPGDVRRAATAGADHLVHEF